VPKRITEEKDKTMSTTKTTVHVPISYCGASGCNRIALHEYDSGNGLPKLPFCNSQGCKGEASNLACMLRLSNFIAPYPKTDDQRIAHARHLSSMKDGDLAKMIKSAEKTQRVKWEDAAR
jgi:hypothetical protein